MKLSSRVLSFLYFANLNGNLISSRKKLLEFTLGFILSKAPIIKIPPLLKFLFLFFKVKVKHPEK